MALWFLLSLTFGVVSTERFDEYVNEAQRQKLFMQHGNDRLRAAVRQVEEQNEHKVVLYHVLPLSGYLMAWLVHGITAKESLEWRNIPGVSAELKISLRHFEPGMSFTSFTRHNASICGKRVLRKVREADPRNAKVLGDGEWSNRWSMPTDIKDWKDFEVTYRNSVQKVYHDCRALAYSELVEDNNKNGPLLEETALADAHVNTGKQFAEYLDAKVGEKWEDMPSFFNGMSTVGVPDRLLDAQINLLGSSFIGAKQLGTPSMWEHFTLWKTAEFDLMKHDELEYIRGPEFGGRPALLDQVLNSFKLSSVTLQKVSNLLSLLRCAALMRFPVKSQDFHERTYIPATTQDLDTDLPKMNLDHVASKWTKAGFARVLLQVVLPPDSANDLAYVSTGWKAERTAPPVGHEHVDWKDVSFMDAYQALKNTAHGDKVTARVLLKRGWGFAPLDMSESVKIIATSMAFADPDFMEFAASLLEDIRNCVLKHPKKKKDESSPWPSRILTVVVLVLCLGVLLPCFQYRRHHLRATTAAMTDVELTEHPLRA
ncbi:unnamed protein product [Symbiodinium sp. CCMP2592]|nr:unnamed protein product [Symbiodinium sp. CCMP2592]